MDRFAWILVMLCLFYIRENFGSSSSSGESDAGKFVRSVSNRRHHQRRSHSLQRRDGGSTPWSCPQVNTTGTGITCQCDLPHTLRCSGVARSSNDLESIIGSLRQLPDRQSVSLLDLSVQNLSRVAGASLFERVNLHGLVISSGEVVQVTDEALKGLGSTLTALGLPNNRLTSIPSPALKTLTHLERLDLSNNRIRAVASHLFDGLDSLRFVDLSGNQIQSISADAFASLVNLRTLHLRSNLLEMSHLNGASLRGLVRLQELDLSYNHLRGRLTTSFLKGLDALVSLDLSVNNITLLKRGMLSSLKRLSTLKLAYNQIDVIEDQAFVSLPALTNLDLSHNEIVAISGQSLSHLTNLSRLDVSHNYLRAVTTDLVAGLVRLESLDVTDNDISLVQPAAVDHLRRLRHLSLTDNPLTCDCHLSQFGLWLQNRSSDVNRLADPDRKSAVCVTPPRLENALLVETDVDLLNCGDDEQPNTASGSLSSPGNSGDNFLSSQPREDFIRLSSAQVEFVSAQLENIHVLHTSWNVVSATLPYHCDAIFIYEISQDQELLLDSYPVGCRSDDPEQLNGRLDLTIKLGHPLKNDGQYRLCLVLFEGHDDEASLLPGCSHSITWNTLVILNPSDHQVDEVERNEEDKSKAGDSNQSAVQITAFYANVTALRSVSIYLRIPDASTGCQFTAVVFEGPRLLARQILNCSVTAYTFAGLDTSQDARTEYQVCVSMAIDGTFLPPPDNYQRQADGDIVLNPLNVFNSSIARYSHCVVANIPTSRVWSIENTLVIIAIAVVFVLVSAGFLVAIYWLAKRLFYRRTKLLSSWSVSSSDALASAGVSGATSPFGGRSSAVPKTTSRHILYVPESDYFSDSSSNNSTSVETCTNV